MDRFLLFLIALSLKCSRHVRLTRFCHFRDGNILLVRHEAQDGEDRKACHKAGAAVQKAQRQAVPATEDTSLSSSSTCASMTPNYDVSEDRGDDGPVRIFVSK